MPAINECPVPTTTGNAGRRRLWPLRCLLSHRNTRLISYRNQNETATQKRRPITKLVTLIHESKSSMASPAVWAFPSCILLPNSFPWQLFKLFAVSVAKWNRPTNLLFSLMRTVSALISDPTVAAIIVPSECRSVQRRLCACYKYLWVSAYFQHTWAGGYARYNRPNWKTVGANMFRGRDGNPLFVFVCLTPIYNCNYDFLGIAPTLTVFVPKFLVSIKILPVTML